MKTQHLAHIMIVFRDALSIDHDSRGCCRRLACYFSLDNARESPVHLSLCYSVLFACFTSFEGGSVGDAESLSG